MAMESPDIRERMEEELLKDGAIQQAKILNLAWQDDDPQWIVAISLNKLDGQEQEEASTIIKRARKTLRKLKDRQTGERIPVPKKWTVLDELPTATQGQVDEKALHRLLTVWDMTESGLSLKEKRAHIAAQAARADTHQIPHDEVPTEETELVLREFWGKVLNIEPYNIGIRDNFLILGGDSINAIELVALAEQYGIRLTVTSIVANPELQKMAAVAVLDDVDSKTYNAEPLSLLPPKEIDTIMREVRTKCGLADDAMVQDAFPCTALQAGIMALSEKQPGSYMTRQIYELPSHVDIPRFERAWEETADRCNNLRARVLPVNGQTIQIMVKGDTAWEDTTGETIDSFIKKSKDITMTYGSRLCRYGLVNDADGKSYFVWIIHHAIFDGLTARIILDNLYQAYHGQTASILRPYSTFIKYITSTDQDAARNFWKTHLQDARRANFPRKLNARSEMISRVMTREISFPYTAEMSLTKATILRAAWAIVLARYCDTDDVCFGTTVSGRQATVPGINQMPGFMIATVPVRIRFQRGESVALFLQNIQKQASEAVPFEQYGLQNIAKLSEDAREACDFANLFVIQPKKSLASKADSGSKDAILLRGSAAEKKLSDSFTQNYFNYPLVLEALLDDNRVDLQITYDSNSINGDALEALFHHFEHVVQQLFQASDRPLSAIDVTGKWDLGCAKKFNPEVPEIVDLCIHQMFENQALRRPTDLAICAWDKSFTYSELSRATNRLAHHLVNKFSIQKEDLVHVCFEKSAWFIVAILAINKAGAAWVPLDPSHPDQRLKQVVSQTRAKVSLASPTYSSLCAGLVDSVVEVCSALDEKLVHYECSARGPKVHISPRNAAYVLFTSGSTGTPKGLVMEHGSVCTSQVAIVKRLGMTPRVRMLQFSAYVFDVSVGEIVQPLISGACCCVPSEASRMNNLAQFIRDKQVNWVYFTPSFARTINPAEVPDLELMLFIGEAVQRDVFDIWVGGKTRLINAWGPAETCVFSSIKECYSAAESNLNIGKPVGAFCWIVDPNDPQRLAPIGTVGEIVVQGPTVLREYLRNPDKTKEAIVTTVPDWAPYRKSRYWDRFYKTGDLAYYNPDGTMEFLSRKDTQVKIRGLRIELGDIEHHIQNTLKSVCQTTVDVFKAETGSQLVAYICYTKERRPTSKVNAENDHLFLPFTEEMRFQVTEIIAELSVLLPPYMIPKVFIPCRFMPVVSSAKLDRNKLRDTTQILSRNDLAQYSLASSYTRKPETAAEIRMQQLWAAELKITAGSIGRDDSFLHLGGDSLVAIHLVTSARKAGLSLTVKDIFGDPRLWAVSLKAVEIDAGANSLQRISPFSLLNGLLNTDSVIETMRKSCGLSTESTIEDAFPCTPLQEGLLALSTTQPGSYIAKQLYRLPADIDIAKFMSSWEQTVEICSSLRTRIVLNEEACVQVVVKDDVGWDSTGGMSLDDYMVGTQNLIMGYGSRLCRYSIIQESRNDVYFAFNAHHCVFDGWSLPLIFNMFSAIYHNKTIPESRPYVHFVSYAMKMDRDVAANYWRSQLQGAQPASFPPAEETQSQIKLTRVKTHSIQFAPLVNQSVTKASILRAAWAIVLSRYSDSNDICFGAVASGRNANMQGLESVIGLVVATVPVRIRLDRQQSIKSFVQQIHNQAIEMIPFEQYGLQNISKLSKEAKQACDFNSLLAIQPAYTHNFADSLLSSVNSAGDLYEKMLQNYLSYPLALQCYLGEDQVTLEFIYDENVLNEWRVGALSRHFDNVVQQLCQQEDNSLDSIIITGPWDLEYAAELNPPISIDENCVSDLISEQVRKKPNHEAIFSTQLSLTYAELDRASSLVASHLSDLGVGPNVIVPFCMEKSVWAIVAMLAIMQSGGAYLPLDPSHPINRRRMIVEEVGASIMITSPLTSTTCEKLANNIIVLSPSLIERLSTSPQLASERREGCSPSNAAYVLFTSGSTGKPKGTVIHHSAACTNIVDLGKAFCLGDASRCLQFASYTFDVSVTEIFSTLASGGTLCVPSETERLQSVHEFMRRANVDVAILTPSFAQIMNPNELPQLETLILMGEPPTRDLLDTWCEHVKLINGYGPTEITVACTTHEFSISDNPTNIGRPFNSACWIVEPDDYHKLAPVGCVGELVVQGHTISHGYINEPEKSKAVFLSKVRCVPSGPNQFYLTGDLVKYNAKGEIEYLGRKDKQVKIRGQRLELGEIEASIRRIRSEISQVGVEVLRRETGDFLTAFISFRESYTDSLADNFVPLGQEIRERLIALVDQLKEELPSYMLPKLTIPLRELPFNAAMKLDRGKLQASVKDFTIEQLMTYSLSKRDRVAPTTAMELKLQALWARVLEVEAEMIGKNDHFFQTGGDSLSAIRLSSLAKQQGIKLPVATIFADPKLSAMAAAVSEGDVEKELDLAPFSLLPFKVTESIADTIRKKCNLLESRIIQDIYPCTAFQEGLMALVATRPGSYIAKNIYKIPVHLDVTTFKMAWERTVELCDNLRTRIVSVDGSCLQVVLDRDISWDTTSASDIQSCVLDSQHLKMDYGSRLSRYSILKDENGEVYFFWTIHHAIFDGWSLGVITKTLTALLRSHALPILYPVRNFIKYTLDMDTEAANEYWLHQLKDAKRASFPAPPPRRRLNSESKRTSIFVNNINLPASTGSSITKATIMRTAWAMILGKYCDSNDVCFATTVAGRNAPVVGLESTPGVTIATVPVRIRIDNNEKLDRFLDRVQLQASEMVAFEQFGLQNITKISSQIKEACDFSSLMVVQPAETKEHDPVLISLNSDERLAEGTLQNYFTYPLILHCFLGEGTVKLAFIYEPIVLAESQIKALSFQFNNVIQQLIVSAGRNVSDIYIAGNFDLEYAMEANGQPPDVIEECVHTLIEGAAVKYPDLSAVSAWDARFTYKELDAVADRLASYLISHFSVQIGDIVHVCFAKSAWYVVATLAISKAGATWSPLDPSHPHERHKQVVSQTGAVLALASPDNVPKCVNLVKNTLEVTEKLNNQYIQQERVTWALLTPSFARTLHPDDVPSLKMLILGGEAVGLDVFDLWFGKLRLFNAWGPTETCVYGAIHEWQSGEESQLTIGRPLGGFCWIVDPNDSEKLAPIGTLGEIVIQGPNLFREYLADARKTAAAAVPAPDWVPYSGSKHWNRFYKTGDLAMYNPDGTMHYYGRKDMQVKIRGLRVELGEIEHHIHRALDGVCQVAVDVLKTEASSNLVAFLCFNDDTILAGTPIPQDLISTLTEELKESFCRVRETLNSALPTYMIPTFFIPCKAIPLATSAKMDRKMLLTIIAQLDSQDLKRYALHDGEENREAPESNMERRLQKLWSENLNIPRDVIYRDTNFLGIGGDSVAAIRLVSCAHNQGIQITVTDVFEDPRLFAVAAKARLIAADTRDVFIQPFRLLEQRHQNVVTKDTTKTLLGLSSKDKVEDAYPCSRLQEGLMALAVKQPGSYIAKFIYRLSEATDIAKFKSAWEHTVKLATNLRTRIIQSGGQSLQLVVKEDLSWDDIRDKSLKEYLNELQSVHMNYGSRLRHDAILRDEAQRKTYFILTLHHAVFDGWSIRNIFNILQKLYNGLDTISVQPYSRFIHYTMELNNEAAVKYWTTQLQGAKPASFPPKKATPNSVTGNVDNTGIVNRTITVPTIATPNITVATILRAAWSIVLARYCETNDICFGATVSGRQAPVPGLVDMLGPIIATIPVRLHTDPKRSVSEFLHHVQGHATEMVQYEQFGIQSISKISEDSKHACDFSSLFVVQPMQSLLGDGDENIMVATEEGKDASAFHNYFNYPLIIQGHIYESRIELVLIYNKNVLVQQQLVALSHQVEHAAQQLASQTDMALGDIPKSSSWDVQTAMKFNSELPDIVDSCVHKLIEEQAIVCPNAPAIDAWDGYFTYASLNQSANRLAQHLLDNYGIQTGDLVHVCFEKTAWYIVSILAINKAGATWVPLDPSHPPQRLTQIVSQTKATTVLTSPTNVSICKPIFSTIIEVTESLDKELAKSSKGLDGECPHTSVSPRDGAYMLFTSGSTGTPKGFLMEHGSVCTSQTAIAKRLGLTSEVRMLQFASNVFDMSVGEIILALVSGACVCVPSDHTRMNGLVDFIRDKTVTWMWSTPSFIRTIKPHDIPTVKLLVLAGEAIPRDVFTNWFGKARLINGWGPAETCVCSTLHEFTSIHESPLTVGRPVGGLCWIVDPDDFSKISPIGTIGEIIIQGPTLLREYLGDKDRTRRTIMTTLPGWAPYRDSQYWSRAYKSGDLGFYNPDGTIEFSARKDTQVKIRGLRVELSEVEHHFQLAFPQAKQIAVDVFKSDGGETLVAYFCMNNDTRTDVDDTPFLPIDDGLESRLTAVVGKLTVALPRYMVPTIFIPCSYMPVITSTKLDRKKLRQLTAGLSQNDVAVYSLVGSQKRAPETDMEMLLQRVWAEILNITMDSIGLDDSFLALGGDSIAAIHLSNTAREEGILLTAKNIFDDPRLIAVAATAKALDTVEDRVSDLSPFDQLDYKTQSWVTGNSLAAKLQLSGNQFVEDAYPCTKLQEGLMVLSLKQPGSYIAKYVYKLSKNVDPDRFKSSWDETISSCDVLRSRLVILDGACFQVVIKEDNLWKSSSGLLEDAIEESKTIRMSYASQLSHFTITMDESGNNYFLWTIHHAIHDGWTIPLILQTFYQAYHERMPFIPQPFSKFIHHLAQTDESAARDYWTKQLANVKPAAFPAPKSASSSLKATRTGYLTTNINFTDSTNSLITKATVFRAAWAILLAKYCDSDDVCFGTTISGRQASLEGLPEIAGPTVATVPVRIRIDREQLASDFLQGVQRQATDMIPYEQFGLQNISRLSPEAKAACEFTSLMVVQPMQDVSEDSDLSSVMVAADDGRNTQESLLQNYYTYPLVVQGHMYNDRVELVTIFDTEILSELQMEALARQFNGVVEQLVLRQGHKIDQAFVASPWDLQLALQFNDSTPVVIDKCVHELISQQARKSPNAPALHGWDGELTYSQLELATDKLASHLVYTYNIRVGDIVHVCFEKSLWYVVAIIAINKAGAVWAPVDPAHPLQRLQQVVEQTGAALTISSATHASLCTGLTKEVIVLDPLLHKKLQDKSSGIMPTVDVTPDDAAYILFTSGSTGTPKGIVMEHRALCTSQTDISKRLNLTSNVRMLQFSSFVFDVSVGEIISPLIHGACICIPSDSMRLNGNLHEFVRSANVTWALLTPSFTRTLKPENFSGLELLVLAGEAFPQEVLNAWYGKLRLINAWGPAETCVYNSIHEWKYSSEEITTIGRPVGSYVWVVDSNNPRCLAPIGCRGEIVVQGPALLREYLSDPAKTSASIITDLHDWVPNHATKGWDRFYKTGDLGYYSYDGNLHFSERKDTQVKIRGLRVELSEIEHQIRSALSIAHQVSVDVFKNEAATHLVAYICFTDSTKNPQQMLEQDDDDLLMTLTADLHTTLNTLADALTLSLPRYMLPTLYIPFNYFPLISSAKLDRVKLRQMIGNFSQDQWNQFALLGSTQKLPPETSMEIRLQTIWANILNIPPETIGRNDSFLHIGGDSISAIELVSSARDAGIQLEINQVFEDSRLSQLASRARNIDLAVSELNDKMQPFGLLSPSTKTKVLDAGRRKEFGLSEEEVIQDAYPCTKLQEGLMAIAAKQQGSYFAKHLFRLSPHVNIHLFKSAWEQTIAACSNLRTKIILVDNVPVQVQLQENPKWETAYNSLESYKRSCGGMKISYNSALCSYALFQDNGHNFFALNIHHAIFDGWSLSLALRTLSAAYQGADLPKLEPYSKFVNLLDDEVDLMLMYDTSMFAGDQLIALSHQFDHVVNQLLAPDEILLDEISVSSAWDLEKAMEYNKQDNELVDACIHDLISAQVLRNPDHEALFSTETSLTYGELERLSTLLAIHLRLLKVTPGTLIPFCFEKSIWAIIAMLGILKSGAAFVPLDPSHPYTRLETIIKETNSNVMITSPTTTSSCQGLAQHTVELSSSFLAALEATAQLKYEHIISKQSASDAAYIIFTSGSTGTPKGVVIHHSALCTTMIGLGKVLGTNPSSRIFQFAGYVFDAMICEIFVTLVYGGTVCVPSETERLQDAPAFIRNSQATEALLTPSFARTINPSQVPTLKTLMVGGEPVSRDLLETWHGKVRLINAYGPTEGCVIATTHDVRSSNDSHMIIGKGFNSACWIVDPDDRRNLTPIGCVGELVLQSHGLSRGYLNDLERTQKAFSDQLSCLGQAQNFGPQRFYFTGDLVRYTPDGLIEYVGRKDLQVKLRGQRMELGEIEYHFKCSLANIEHVAVDVLHHKTGMSLVAFISFVGDMSDGNLLLPIDDSIRPSLESVRAYVKARVPPYMMPSLILPIRYMPFVSSMKMDRMKLLDLAAGLSAEQMAGYSPTKQARAEPTTEMEKKLLELSAQVLKIDPCEIGRHDKFLEIGGDSITAIQLVNLAGGAGISLTVADIFKDSQISVLSSLASRQQFTITTHLEPFSLLPHSKKDNLLSEITRLCGLPSKNFLEDAYPCTQLQQGLMALTVKQPGSYIAKNFYKFSKDVDIGRFMSAWDRTIELCSNLRTRIVLVDGTAIQVILRNCHKWESIGNADLSTYLQKMSGIQFSYGSNLVQYALLEDEGNSYFSLAMHHSIFDGWSMSLIIRTLEAIYRQNKPPSLSQYARFVKYTMELDHDATRRYWLEQLHGAKCAAFPSKVMTTSSANPVTSYVSKKVDFTNYPKTSITKASVIRAAWAIVLARYCDTNDICFGATVSGRNAALAGADSMPGVMLATVPVRVQLNNSQRVSDYLCSIQDQSTKMVAHEQFGLPNISSLGVNAKEACNFSSLLVIQPAGFFTGGHQNSDAILIDDSSEQKLEERIQNFINYPLVIQGLVYGNEVDILLMYNASCMAKFQAVAISEQLGHVIQHLLSNTEENLESISVAGHWDLQQAINWNTACLEPCDECLHDLFSKQAQRRPEHEAIHYTGGSITYAELDVLSSQLAIFLRKQGVKPESFVPICFEKSPWVIVAMLGILKAGGAFIPLDPNHPVARRQALVDEVGAQIMITSSSTAAECAHMTKTIIELSPTLISSLSGIKETQITNTAAPTNAAYMLFTSGSTGRPKGVIIEHQGICTSLLGEHKTFNIDENSRWFQFANYVFDACITEIFAALTAGGTVCVPTESERMHQTAKFITDAQVNIALLTPTVVKTIAPESVPSLKTLILGGEAASKDIIETWYGQLDLRNAYGPAEACIASSVHIYTSSTDLATLIGHGFAHHCWIVDPDDYQHLAPIGCIGELLVQGPALARGYFKDDSKTKSSFVEDVSWLPKELTKFRRFYKTGDLVRYNDDGIMEYLGRKDTQIKIRGQRIEVGEIEYHMKNLETALEHVAVDVTHEKHLTAFVTFRDGEFTNRATGDVEFQTRDDAMSELFTQLLANMSHILPQHMIPSYIVPVRHMPHNSAGKLDRKLLLQTAHQLSNDDFAQHLSSQRTVFRNCSNETETWIRSQWAHALNLPAKSISVDDNFYHLGGDSIRIVTVAKAILDEYQITLDLSILNSKYTTISSMAKFVEDTRSNVTTGRPVVDLMEKIQLATEPLQAANLDSLAKYPIVKLSNKSTVFLTGATGFLGTELLRQLLQNRSIESVIALVRCTSPQHGLERIRTTAQAAQWWHKHHAKKIEVWVGDLGESRLGLNASQWDRLLGTSRNHSNIDAIVHNGAVVNWNADYDKLVAPNVSSTIDLLNATASSPVHPRFVFVSGGLKTDPEEIRTAVTTQLGGLNGYVQTKFVCESVIQDIVRNLPKEQNRLSIVKPGRIIGSENNGVANVDDLIWRVVSGAAAIHAYPVEPLENWMYIADVDRVASTVLNQLFYESAVNYFVHVTGGMPTPVFWEKVNEVLKIKCRPVSWAEWKELAYASMAEVGDRHPLWPVQYFLGALGAPRSAKELATETLGHEQWHKAVRKNVQYLMEIGFITSSVEELGNVKDGAIKRQH
ncbi:hypothetical protein V8C35DRAFT_327290 [Trichoderma chlorosporum]